LYLEKIKAETKVEIRSFPEDVLSQLKKAAASEIEAVANKDAASKKIYANYQAFRKRISPWAELSERSYHSKLSSI